MSDQGELVPTDMHPQELREEVNHRTCKAGYTTRNGGPIPLKIMVTGGLGPTKLNIWPRDAQGRLID